VDARQRFLHPASLPSPRSLNPALSLRTERAILWSIELHPNDRPSSAEELRQFLLGTKELPARPASFSTASKMYTIFAKGSIEKFLLGSVLVLLVLGFLASLIP
jgi:serine/threonine-protein kinase